MAIGRTHSLAMRRDTRSIAAGLPESLSGGKLRNERARAHPRARIRSWRDRTPLGTRRRHDGNSCTRRNASSVHRADRDGSRCMMPTAAGTARPFPCGYDMRCTARPGALRPAGTSSADDRRHRTSTAETVRWCGNRCSPLSTDRRARRDGIRCIGRIARTSARVSWYGMSRIAPHDVRRATGSASCRGRSRSRS